jgi:hypothetical protein
MEVIAGGDEEPRMLVVRWQSCAHHQFKKRHAPQSA